MLFLCFLLVAAFFSGLVHTLEDRIANKTFEVEGASKDAPVSAVKHMVRTLNDKELNELARGTRSIGTVDEMFEKVAIQRKYMWIVAKVMQKRPTFLQSAALKYELFPRSRIQKAHAVYLYYCKEDVYFDFLHDIRDFINQIFFMLSVRRADYAGFPLPQETQKIFKLIKIAVSFMRRNLKWQCEYYFNFMENLYGKRVNESPTVWYGPLRETGFPRMHFNEFCFAYKDKSKKHIYQRIMYEALVFASQLKDQQDMMKHQVENARFYLNAIKVHVKNDEAVEQLFQKIDDFEAELRASIMKRKAKLVETNNLLCDWEARWIKFVDCNVF